MRKIFTPAIKRIIPRLRQQINPCFCFGEGVSGGFEAGEVVRGGASEAGGVVGFDLFVGEGVEAGGGDGF
jgi:hypothetical protein